MAKTIHCAVAACFVLLVVWADDRTLLAEEERRWNTPPELTPEQIIKKPDRKNARFLSFPITANINVNTGSNANLVNVQGASHSVGYSGTNSFSHSSAQGNGAISQSQSMSFGSTGMAAVVSPTNNHHHSGHYNPGDSSLELGFGNAASSVSVAHSSTIRFPDQGNKKLTWTNIRPNHNNNGHQSSQFPKLHIDISPQHGHNREPIRLHVSSQQSRWENRQPKVHVHTWQPNYRSHHDDIQP